MSQTTTTELQDRAETITSHLDAIETAADDGQAVEAGVTRQTIEQRLDEIDAHRVPMDEAVQTVVRGVVREAGLERTELPIELAQLAGYSTVSSLLRAMLGSVAV